MNRNKQWWQKNFTSLLLAGFSGFIFKFFLERTGFDSDSSQIHYLCWLFPVALFMFDVLSRSIVIPAKRRQAECVTQWASLSVFPFLSIGITWNHIESWQFALSLFIWLYIILRTGSILIFRQSSSNPHSLNTADGILVFWALLLLNIWKYQPLDVYEFLPILINAIVSGLIALLCGMLARRFTTSDFDGTTWQRCFVLLVAVSPPLLMVSSKVTSYHLLAICLLGFMTFCSNKNRSSLTIAIVTASLVLILAPIVFPAGSVVSIWFCLTLLAWQHETRKIEGILLSGGAIILFLAGFLIGGLRWKGLFPPGNYIYGVPTGYNWLSPFLDRSNGLLLLAPWSILPISGWIQRTVKQSLFDLSLWLGFPIVLSGLLIGSWVSFGRPPDWSMWLILIPLLFPFAGALWRHGFSTIESGLIRVLGFIGFSISGFLYIGMTVFHSDTSIVNDILNEFTLRTGIDLFPLFPSFNYSSPGHSTSIFIWLFIAVSLATGLIVTRKFRKSTGFGTALTDMIVTAIFIALMGAAIKYTQIWYVLPMTHDAQIEPGQVWSLDTGLKSKTIALKMLTNLSRSTHIPQGQTVADIKLVLENGQTIQKHLEAGVHTAEWAYERPDVLRAIQHKKPPAASTWMVEEPDGFTFQGQVYEGLIFFESPLKIRSIQISNPEENKNGPMLTVKGMGLMMQTDTNKWRAPNPLLKDNSIRFSANQRLQTYELSGETFYREIYLDTALVNAASVKDGTTIARITIGSRDGLQKFWQVKAGSDTAEWSINRPDMIGRILHRMPRIATSERRLYLSTPYLAHVYRTSWRWHPELAVTSITIEFSLISESEPAPEWIVYGLVLR
ncbi:hypothetical protein JW823_02445 [bacterium]|nr:hypothetical protein [candidate division CSSED10-310 bacterium]